MAYKVLIADSDRVVHKLVEEFISVKNEYTLIKAMDGQQALELAEKLVPDVVFVDVDLPLLNGLEFAHQLKIKLKTNVIPVILLYTEFDIEIVEKAIENGITDILRKPFDRVEFWARLKSAMLYSQSLKENYYQRERIELHENELNKLSLIIRETANSVIIFTPQGEIEWVNEGFKKLYGYDLAEFKEKFGNNIFALSSSPDLIRRKFMEVVRTRKSVSYVNSYLSPDGKRKWIQTTLTPIFDSGVLERIVAIETDITKEKEAELSLVRRNKEIEKLAEELQKANEELKRQKQLIMEERQKTNQLLENILPHHVAQQLITWGYAKPRKYKMATVMFTDFKGFTRSCEHLSPEQIVDYLHHFFSKFDDIIVEHYIEKIKTIGDAYMCVGGVPLRNRSNPFDVVLAGLEIQHFMSNLDLYDPEKKLPRWQLRIGIHTGPLVAGVVGKIKFAYDVWGDTVNVAQRLESACEVGRVNISETTYEHIKDYFDCEYRGKIEIKNHAKIAMYYVNGIRKEYAEDEAGVVPNEEFRKFLNAL